MHVTNNCVVCDGTAMSKVACSGLQSACESSFNFYEVMNGFISVCKIIIDFSLSRFFSANVIVK